MIRPNQVAPIFPGGTKFPKLSVKQIKAGWEHNFITLWQIFERQLTFETLVAIGFKEEKFSPRSPKLVPIVAIGAGERKVNNNKFG
jgi:hypothetical protein